MAREVETNRSNVHRVLKLAEEAVQDGDHEAAQRYVDIAYVYKSLT